MKKLLILSLPLFIISCGLKQNPLIEDLLVVPPSRIIEYTKKLYSLENDTEKLYLYSSALFENIEGVDSIDIIERGRDKIFSNKVILECLINPKNIMWENLKFQDSRFKELLEKRALDFQNRKGIDNLLEEYKQIVSKTLLNSTSTSIITESTLSSSDEPKRVTKAEADAFMENRMIAINQTLMRTKVADFNGTTLYYYLSVAENGMTCVSAVSELKLEVIGVDCGETYRKIEEWNAIR